MNHTKQIEKLIQTQVAIDTDKLLADHRAQVTTLVEAETADAYAAFIERRVTERLSMMRPVAEKQARASIVGKLMEGAEDAAPIEVPEGTLSASALTALLTQSLDPITAARGIVKAKGKWACAFCEKTYDSQRAATQHSKRCPKRTEMLKSAKKTKANGEAKKAKTKTKAKTKKTKAKKRVTRRQCIKPGCEETSKGPRFRYLCDEHKGAPMRHVRAWQRLSREE